VLPVNNEGNAGMTVGCVLNDQSLGVTDFVVTLAQDEIVGGLAGGVAKTQGYVGVEVELTGGR
jgi:hypothetical protein